MTAIAIWNQVLLRTPAAMVASPQVKLEASRKPVSIATLRRSNSSRPPGPPAVCPSNTAYVAKNAENITMSERMKIQKP